MIFFEQEVIGLISSNGMNLSPIPCVLNDGRSGFYLSDYWALEITSNGTQVEHIDKRNIISSEGFI